jgi:hypothetical protein
LRHTQERLQEATRSVEARIEHRHNGGTT